MFFLHLSDTECKRDDSQFRIVLNTVSYENNISSDEKTNVKSFMLCLKNSKIFFYIANTPYLCR